MPSIARIEEIYRRLNELENSLNGDATDDETRADILDEISHLEDELDYGPS